MSLRQALKRTGKAWSATAYDGQGALVAQVVVNFHTAYAVQVSTWGGTAYYSTLEEVEHFLRGQEKEGWECK